MHTNLSILSLLLFTIPLGVIADSQYFQLVAKINIWDLGSELEYDGIVSNRTFLQFSRSPGLGGVVDNKGRLHLSDGSYALVKEASGYLMEGPENSASQGFSIKDGYLYHKGKKFFYAIREGQGPQGGIYQLSARNSTQNTTSVALSVNATNFL